jgi:hypothetical protein
MMLCLQQNARQNNYMKIANRFFENVAQFKDLGKYSASQNLIQGEIKKIFNSGNVCYHSFWNLFTCLLSKTIRI